jgi:hypothetical protein
MWRGDLEAERMRHRASLTKHDGEVKGLNDVIWQSGDCSLPDGHPALVNHKWPAPGSALP